MDFQSSIQPMGFQPIVFELIEADSGLIGYSLDAYGAYSDHEDDGYDDFIRKIPMEERDEQIIFEDKPEKLVPMQ
jgi:hypothetical protein